MARYRWHVCAQITPTHMVPRLGKYVQSRRTPVRCKCFLCGIRLRSHRTYIRVGRTPFLAVRHCSRYSFFRLRGGLYDRCYSKGTALGPMYFSLTELLTGSDVYFTTILVNVYYCVSGLGYAVSQRHIIGCGIG